MAGLMSVEDVAAHFQVSTATVHTWIHKNAAPRSMRIGKYRRFRVEDVLAWEDEQARKSAR
jgi:excisionase family DNA binding protein